MKLQVRPWRGLAAFSALAPAWQRLAREAGLDPLCNDHAWYEAHVRAFGTEATLFGWTFEHEGEPVAILALRREPPRGPFALRRALLAADGTFDSDYLDVPIRPGCEAEVAHLLLDAARGEPGLEALVLAGLPADSRFLAALRAELERRGLPRREHDVPCLCAPLPDSFEAYLAGLKARMRSKVRSAMRAAQTRGATLVWCERAEELEGWLAELYRLHALRWRAEGHAGSFEDPRRRAFFQALARAALTRDELCFARLEEGGAVVAIQFGLRTGTRYYQIQEGFDPARESERVGTALRGLALAELVSRGVRAYDFMAGDSRHKRDWGGLLRPCTTIAFPLPRWRARLAYRLREGYERWRRKSAPPAPAGARED